MYIIFAMRALPMHRYRRNEHSELRSWRSGTAAWKRRRRAAQLRQWKSVTFEVTKDLMRGGLYLL